MVTSRRGRPSLPAIWVAATESGGDTMAPRANASPQDELGTRRWKTTATSSMVASTRPTASPRTGLAVGLVLATMALVAVVFHLLVPSSSWGEAFALGAIVSPPDSVAATQIAGKLGLPRRLVTILGGEGLMNDATALTAYQLAIAAVDATPCSRVRVEVDGVSCRSSSSAKDADDRNACLLEGGSVDGCTGGTLAALLVVT